MRPWHIHPEAETEFTEAEAFYEQRSRGLGQSFAVAVEAAVERVQQYPNAGTNVYGRVRRYLVSGFPYSVLYVPREERIFIVAVAHQKRRPLYWTRRLSR